jgi:hypothetical protein
VAAANHAVDHQHREARGRGERVQQHAAALRALLERKIAQDHVARAVADGQQPVTTAVRAHDPGHVRPDPDEHERARDVEVADQRRLRRASRAQVDRVRTRRQTDSIRADGGARGTRVDGDVAVGGADRLAQVAGPVRVVAIVIEVRHADAEARLRRRCGERTARDHAPDDPAAEPCDP